jgi:hypothetical protein
MKEVWGKDGKVYYVDDNGNRLQSGINPLQKFGRQIQAGLTNINDWINESDPNSEAYKQKANLVLGLSTMPIGGGLLSNVGANLLKPYIGRKMAQTVAQGVGSGATGGAVEGFGRGVIEGKNPLKTMATDAAIGALTGGATGYGLSKIAKHLEGKQIFNNPLKQDEYYKNYVEGLKRADKLGQESPLSKGLAEYTALRDGFKYKPSSKRGLFDQDSWHGTPFEGDIEKFDLDFMGSGEGAQMYGAGVYTAKGKDIANKHYRFIGEDIEPIKYKGKPLMSLYDDLERQANRLHPREAQSYYDKMSLLEDLDYKGGLDDLDYFNPEIQTWYKKEIEPNLTMPGRLYRVQVPDNDVLLHSELPLNEQPQKVQKALRDMFFDQGVDIDDTSNIYDMGTLNQQPYSEVSGQTLYNIMNGLIDGNATNRRATSKLFDEYGIKGIRAFGDRDGEIFVTFNPENAKIVESYYPNKLYDALTNQKKTLKNPKLSGKINYIDMMDDAEKARVTSEFNTNLSKAQLKRKNIRKAVGNYYYTAKNNGFDNYEFTGRYLIDDLYD